MMNLEDIKTTVNMALKEDLGGIADAKRDVTASLIDPNTISKARVITREDGVFSEVRQLVIKKIVKVLMHLFFLSKFMYIILL